ncbi:helix-turn-helix domain-containing protein [Planctomycetota bacterium]
MPNPTNDYFAEHLKHIRQLKSLSQGDLAKLTGLKPAAISHLETGQQKPSFDTLVKLADALGVSMDCLFDREADNANSPTASSKLLKDFEKLPPKEQEVVQDLVQVMLLKNQPED